MYVPMGDAQEASKSDLAGAINDLIDHFNLTDVDDERIREILTDNSISFEE